MALKQRVVTEIFDDQTEELLHREVVQEKAIQSPKVLEDLGHSHKEQIDMLQSIEDNFLVFQSKIYDLPTICPSCGSELRNYGSYASEYNSVFTDHKITLARKRCTNPECRRLLTSTVQGLFGEYRHPELLKMQVETAASHSFIESQNIMDAKVKKHRGVNGQLNIKRTVDRIGILLNDIHQDESSLKAFSIHPSAELIIQTDGGHIKDKHPNRTSFEALVSKVYSPKHVQHNISKAGNTRGQITQKSYAASSCKDHHKSIKQMTLLAAKKEGLSKETEIIALSDGAKNCWNVLKSLNSHCRSIIYILDWWHIQRKFDTLIGQLPSEEATELESIKWKIWHGRSDEAITRLTTLYTNLIVTPFSDKAHDLLKYVVNNQGYLVNYQDRKSANKVFTSSAIESSIESVVNQRLKKKQKAQWHRESAHNILQIRTSVLSKQWDTDWELAKDKIYKIAA